MEQLPVWTDDPAILALWETGLARWGHAFIAFCRLDIEMLRTPDCLRTFEDSYITTFESMDALIDDHLEGMGWAQPLRELLDKYYIPEEMLRFDREAALRAFREFMDVVEEGGQVHVFSP